MSCNMFYLQIGDAGVKALTQCKKLSLLSLMNCEVSAIKLYLGPGKGSRVFLVLNKVSRAQHCLMIP